MASNDNENFMFNAHFTRIQNGEHKKLLNIFRLFTIHSQSIMRHNTVCSSPDAITAILIAALAQDRLESPD
jgi:glycerol-3-phosphate responsive antiterminator